MGGQEGRGGSSHAMVAGPHGVEPEMRCSSHIEGRDISTPGGVHGRQSVISQKTTGSWVRKGKDIVLVPNGKEFEMKVFQIHSISGACSSSKVPECRM